MFSSRPLTNSGGGLFGNLALNRPTPSVTTIGGMRGAPPGSGSTFGATVPTTSTTTNMSFAPTNYGVTGTYAASTSGAGLFGNQPSKDPFDFCCLETSSIKMAIRPSQQPSNPLDALVSLQRSDGSWSSTDVLRLINLPLSKFESLRQQFGSDELLLTVLVVAYITRHYNLPEYALILKKGRTWITKTSNTKAISLTLIASAEALIN